VRLAEFPAGMENGQHQFQPSLLVFRMHVHRDAAAVIADRERIAGFVEYHRNVIRETIDVFIDGVIKNFPGEMMETLAIDAADIHGGSLPDRLQSFENLDVFRAIGRCSGGGKRTHFDWILCSLIVSVAEPARPRW